MISYTDIEPGIFYAVGQGHVITRNLVKAGPFSLGTEYSLNTMFSMFELLRDGAPVGYYLYSGFKVVNKGGVLVTYLESKKGKGESSRIVVRQPELVVYSDDPHQNNSRRCQLQKVQKHLSQNSVPD